MRDASDPSGWSPLLAGGPSAVKRWLAKVEPGHQDPSQTVNWLGLAETAASLARSELDLDWAEIAIYIYDQLARKVDSASRRESLMYSQMNLRAFLITRLGPRTGHPVLDPRPVVDWFSQALNMSVEEAKQEASHWVDLDIGRIRELRRIKNRLAPIKLLDDAKLLPAESRAALSPWLAMREMLP